MRLRRARPEDAEAIAALTREAYAKWVEVIGREPLPMRVDYAEAVTRRRFDLIECDGELVALIETTPEDDWLLIENLAVRPALQKRGYGGRLLRVAERIAASAGLSGLRLYTNKLFVDNIRFYERFGFATEREAPLNGGMAVYMTKKTPPAEHEGES